MEPHTVKILGTEWLTHDVKRITFEKPRGYKFVPGQATEVSVNINGWREEKRPFTFTALNSWPHLEFVIKTYPERNGVTARIATLEAGDELLIRDVWGTISYGGPGVFIAAGAGITPFISILRQLNEDKAMAGNMLIFSNKTAADIILRKELEDMKGLSVNHVLTRDKTEDTHHGRLDVAYLKKTVPSFRTNFYVCGPEEFTADVLNMLEANGAQSSSLIFER